MTLQWYIRSHAATLLLPHFIVSFLLLAFLVIFKNHVKCYILNFLDNVNNFSRIFQHFKFGLNLWTKNCWKTTFDTRVVAKLQVFNQLNQPFKFPAYNSKVFWAGNLNFKFRIVFWNIFFWRFGDLKNESHFLKKSHL